ncbi:hypothetical protein B0T22DRAFT_474947 [Podospora appendiculata]|uniref:Transmembrane protein n=1 Tax=Podospora appendiculata TaxID=314037 RepID=A0AAE0WYG0_9PEZI|nr:hypothetical protein B0T22DRAFT_474947 [Podospora appendiculata]
MARDGMVHFKKKKKTWRKRSPLRDTNFPLLGPFSFSFFHFFSLPFLDLAIFGEVNSFLLLHLRHSCLLSFIRSVPSLHGYPRRCLPVFYGLCWGRKQLRGAGNGPRDIFFINIIYPFIFLWSSVVIVMTGAQHGCRSWVTIELGLWNVALHCRIVGFAWPALLQSRQGNT